MSDLNTELANKLADFMDQTAGIWHFNVIDFLADAAGTWAEKNGQITHDQAAKAVKRNVELGNRCDRLWVEMAEAKKELSWTKAQRDDGEVVIKNRDAEIVRLKKELDGYKRQVGSQMDIIKKLQEELGDDDSTRWVESLKDRDRTINELRGMVASYKFDWENARDNLSNANNTIAAMRASELDTHRATQKEISEQRERADNAEKGREEALDRAKDAEVAHAGYEASLKEAQKMVSWLTPFAFAGPFSKDANLPKMVEVERVMRLQEKQWCKHPGPPGYAACTREKHKDGPCAHPYANGRPDVVDLVTDHKIQNISSALSAFTQALAGHPFRWWIVFVITNPKSYTRLLARTETEAKELGRAELGCRFVSNVDAYYL